MFVPYQRSINRSRAISLNLHQRWMVKHDTRISRFESRAELYYAALLEGDERVRRYVPQPFDLKIKSESKDTYRPDFYVHFFDGDEVVVEVSTPDRRDSRPEAEATKILRRHGMTYQIVSTDVIYPRRIEAENWLLICQHLVLLKDVDNQAAIAAVRSCLTKCESINLDEIGRTLPHIPALQRAGAICKLLHSHEASASSIDTEPLTRQTRVRLMA